MNPDYNESLKYLTRYFFFKIMPERFYIYALKYKYKKTYKRILNLKNPLRLSEKLQWLKLYDNTDEKTFFADKLKAKKYIQENIPGLKTAKLYQSALSFNETDFGKLPLSFLLKTNHAWKTNTYIRNKNKITQKEMSLYEKNYNKVLKINYAYWSYYELHYKNIKPQIFAEELLDKDICNISNYEVYCFNGKPEFILYRKAKEYFEQQIYSITGERLNFDIEYKSLNEIEKPQNLKITVEFAETLCRNFKFVRVDFFESNNEIYFGEMTFTPYSGFIKFIPDSFDLFYGNKLNIK